MFMRLANTEAGIVPSMELYSRALGDCCDWAVTLRVSRSAPVYLRVAGVAKCDQVLNAVMP